MDKIEVTHKCFEIINNLKEKYNWNILIQNSADKMGIEKTTLEKIIEETNLYYWNNQEQKYTLK